jgi:cell division protein FtsA
MALHTPLGVAERVKIDHGSLKASANSDVIELPIIGKDDAVQEVALEVVSNVIYARIEETLMIIASQLEKSGFKNQLGAGVILTGGMTKLDGLVDVTGPLFDNMPVRIAKPSDIEGLFDSLKDPAFATVLGLVRYGSGEYTLYEIDSNKKLRTREGDLESGAKSAYSSHSASEEADYHDSEAKISQEKADIADIMVEPKRNSNEPNLVQKTWRWMTQIF